MSEDHFYWVAYWHNGDLPEQTPYFCKDYETGKKALLKLVEYLIDESENNLKYEHTDPHRKEYLERRAKEGRKAIKFMNAPLEEWEEISEQEFMFRVGDDRVYLQRLVEFKG